MGVKEVETLNIARRIAMFNSEAIYYVKNSLMVNTPQIQKKLDIDYEKFVMIIRDSYEDVKINTILANTDNNHNHDLLKLDVELIYDTLIEGYRDGA